MSTVVPNLPSALQRDQSADGRVALLLGELLPRMTEIRILAEKLAAAAPASLRLLPTEIRLLMDALELVQTADNAGKLQASLGATPAPEGAAQTQTPLVGRSPICDATPAADAIAHGITAQPEDLEDLALAEIRVGELIDRCRASVPELEQIFRSLADAPYGCRLLVDSEIQLLLQPLALVLFGIQRERLLAFLSRVGTCNGQ